jgi:MOSC domain-containing protein YiiM
VKVLSVNCGRARPVQINGRRVMTAIAKDPAPEGTRVAVLPLGLQGDEQADQSVHGGLSKAVYAYASEHTPRWEAERNRALGLLFDTLPPGSMGENLSLQGVLEADLWIGDQLVMPDCALMVSEPRFPCFKFNARMGFNQAAKFMVKHGLCGVYLSVSQAGSVGAGDLITLVPGRREVRLLDVFLAKARA